MGEDVVSGDCGIRDEVVLILRRFPGELSDEDGRDLLANFGATRLTIVRRNKNKNVVYATFANKKAAEAALVRLHQLRVMGRRLVVEFASDTDRPDEAATTASSRDVETNGQSVPTVDTPKKALNMRDDVQEFSRDLNALGRSFGLDYPMSSKLYYSYPRPTPMTLANIGGALLAVPKFYHQVLHLMNKMNLPAPFGPQIHFPGLAFVIPDELSSRQEALDRLTGDAGDEEEESELESEPEEGSCARRAAGTDDFVSNEKRRRLRLAKSLRPMKRVKLQQFFSDGLRSARGSSGGGDNARPEEVFELPTSQTSKRIEFKLDVRLAETNESAPADDVVNTPGVVVEDSEQVATEPIMPVKKSFTDNELNLNRLSKKAMNELPVFKNYNSGTATRRLYLKNLAKQVDEDDLRAVYQRYVGGETETFDVRLMREGRMKGQAFITFENEENARNALDNTNGFVLHGKPFVVQFARCDKNK